MSNGTVGNIRKRVEPKKKLTVEVVTQFFEAALLVVGPIYPHTYRTIGDGTTTAEEDNKRAEYMRFRYHALRDYLDFPPPDQIDLATTDGLGLMREASVHLARYKQWCHNQRERIKQAGAIIGCEVSNQGG